MIIGTMLGRNRIVEKIGEGGMAAVYRAHDEHLGRDVAIKVLPPGALSDASARRRFRKEAIALSKLNHPNIETIYDFDTQDGIDYLVMECISGLTLKELLARGPITEKEITRLGMQMAEGLAAAHDQGIVHCDFKPGNLMISSDGRLKVLDFGLARLARPKVHKEVTTDSSTQDQGAGTLPYMAPEQLTGEPLDGRTDIYAFGNVLYEMATGRLPFQEVLSTALVNEIVHRPPPPPGRYRADLSSRLEEIILKCLEKDPENRYQSAKELLVDLRRASMTDPAHVLLMEPRRRKKAALIAGAGLLILAVLGFLAVRTLLSRFGQETLPDYEPHQITSAARWEGQPVLSPDATRIAYASNETGNLDICVTDIRGSVPLRLTDSPADDMEPAWYPDGHAVAFTSDRSGAKAIWRVSAFGGGATLLIPEARMAALSPDQTRIGFVRDLPAGGSQIAVARLDNLADITLLTDAANGKSFANHPAWSPDSREICYSDRQELWIVPATGGRARPITTGGEDKSEPTWSPDGMHIYFSSWQDRAQAIWRIRADGSGKPVRITPGIGPECHPSLSRENRSLLVHGTSSTNRQLSLLDRESGKESVLPGFDWYMPTIAPDGSKIVCFPTRSGFARNLWVQALDHGKATGTPYPLFEVEGVSTYPAFSPDSAWIAFYRILGDKRDIWTTQVSGGKQIQFTQDGKSNKNPAWSRDGSMIAYASERSGSSQIWVAPVKDGQPAGAARQLTRGEFTAYAPVWSPDGATIAFQGLTKEHSEAWLVPSDGSRPPWPLTDGMDIRRVRWDWHNGYLLASGLWGGNSVVLRSISPDSGKSAAYQPAVDLGGKNSFGFFDITPDGKWLVFVREEMSGHIWLAKSNHGFY